LPVPERTTLDEEASGRAPGKLPRLECGTESQQQGAGQVLGVGVAVGVGNGRGGGHHFATGPEAVRQGSRKVGLLKCGLPMGARSATLRLEQMPIQ
jgi:hypothetical protein